MNKQNLLFVSAFAVIALIAIMFFGVSDVLGICVASCVGGVISSLMTGARKAFSWESSGAFKVVLLPSSVSAVVMAFLLMAKFYILTAAIGITGSPYDVYDINYFRVALITWGLSFVTLVVTLLAYDKFHQSSPSVSGQD